MDNYFVTVKKNTQTIQWHGIGSAQVHNGEKRTEMMAKQMRGRNLFHDAWLMLIGSMIG
jgi:hypothetical protein